MRDFSIPTRSAAIMEHGMAATSNPLATLAAIDMLRQGGNAIDAAITAVAVQSVVEPHMSGIGGDCFVMYSPLAGTPLAFNGSGRAPAGAECEWYSERDFSEIPEQSPHAVTVPGAIDAWCRLLADHGTKDLYEVLMPAIRRAERVQRRSRFNLLPWRIPSAAGMHPGQARRLALVGRRSRRRCAHSAGRHAGADYAKECIFPRTGKRPQIDQC
jgi:gamma-glutamyltranspeptidase / glutathione hydrolase